MRISAATAMTITRVSAYSSQVLNDGSLVTSIDGTVWMRFITI